MRAQPLSIYLLKPGQTIETAIDTAAPWRKLTGRALPPGGTILGLSGKSRTPDWCDYFEVEETVERHSEGGIVFVPTKTRLFAMPFGPAYHKLNEDSYEHDFGLQFILNAALPDKLRSADICEPGAARLRRTQIADESDLTLLDFKYDAEVLKSITARVHPLYADWFESATGATSLKLNIKERGEKLGQLCELLFKAYSSNAWKKNFPGAQNIARVREPSLVDALDAKLLTAIAEGCPTLHLAAPEIIDHHGAARARFSGAGATSMETEIFLQPYLDYLVDRGIGLKTLTIPMLKRHKVQIVAGDAPSKPWPIYRALLFETKLPGIDDTFHLLDRTWYRAKAAFMQKLHADLDARWIPSPFPTYAHASEGDYNAAMAKNSAEFALLDKTNVAPAGMTPVEPADHMMVKSGVAVLIHVKVSTFSFKLSHLFNQGATALELLRESDAARLKLKRLINDLAPADRLNAMSLAIDRRKFAVIYAIVSHKDANAKALNLPLFSRITLRRSIKALRAMETDARFCFIPVAAPVKKRSTSARHSRPGR